MLETTGRPGLPSIKSEHDVDDEIGSISEKLNHVYTNQLTM